METKYWLTLLESSHVYTESLEFELNQIEEIICLLAAIVKTLATKK